MTKNRKHAKGEIRRGLAVTAILMIVIFGVRGIFSASAAFRTFYLETFYPSFSRFLRILFGWFPFSLGDLLYLVLGILILFGIFRLIRSLFLIRKFPLAWLKILLLFLNGALGIYLIFLLFWGFNYRTSRVKQDFGVSMEKYSLEEVADLCRELIRSANKYHRIVADNDSSALQLTMNFNRIKRQALADYGRIRDLGIYYRSLSVKPSLFGYFMNYSGVTGYYNPFTGEAQVNTTPPPVSVPFTTCHEMAHQLGFAPEEEANFIGYLVASNSSDPLFRYSADFTLLLYSISSLSSADRKLADSLWKNLVSPGVRKDYKRHQAFFKKFETAFKPVSDKAYDKYLKANDQKAGILSYDGVVALVIDYRKKHPPLP